MCVVSSSSGARNSLRLLTRTAINRIEINDNLAVLWCEFSERNPSQFKQKPSSRRLLAVMVFIRHENNLFYTCLNDELRTFITWEQGHIHTAALHVGRILVHDGVQLGVAHCGKEKGRGS